MDTGDDIEVAIQNPLAMLDAVASESMYFSNLIAATYARQPCTKANPWKIVLYISACVGGPTTRLCGERRSQHTTAPSTSHKPCGSPCARHANALDAEARGPRRRQPQRRHQQDAQPQVGGILLDYTRMAHRFAVSADTRSQRCHASDARTIDRSLARCRRRRVVIVAHVASPLWWLIDLVRGRWGAKRAGSLSALSARVCGSTRWANSRKSHESAWSGSTRGRGPTCGNSVLSCTSRMGRSYECS